jgi:hypothetical protein
LEILRQHPDGLTREQISVCSGLKLQSVCGRCAELLQTGAITLKDLPGDSDYYEVRLTASGRPAAVLTLRDNQPFCFGITLLLWAAASSRPNILAGWMSVQTPRKR